MEDDLPEGVRRLLCGDQALAPVDLSSSHPYPQDPPAQPDHLTQLSAENGALRSALGRTDSTI